MRPVVSVVILIARNRRRSFNVTDNDTLLSAKCSVRCTDDLSVLPVSSHLLEQTDLHICSRYLYHGSSLYRSMKYSR
jgi:hypothetical protein